MNRLAIVIAAMCPVLAQTPAPVPQAPATNSGTSSPEHSAESWLSGSIDVGYRWNAGFGGSVDTYRSFVNLGAGPKLLGTEFTIIDPNHRLFDQIRVEAYNWGDEPYQTLHIEAKKSQRYDFNADYRDIAFFDFSPSYADPLLARGIVLNEQSFDTRRHLGSFQLDLLPGNWVIPYFAYDRDSDSGQAASVFVTGTNEFPVPDTMSSATNVYRGGVRFEFRRFHVTLEQGGTTFSSGQICSKRQIRRTTVI